MFIDVNGKAGLSLKAAFPRIGAWHADLKVDSPQAITSPVTVVINGGVMVLKGSVVRGGAFVEAAELRIVAGSGRLNRPATPRHYNSPRVRAILGHLLGDAGETLSSTVSATLLDRNLDYWTTAALPGGALLTRLCATLGADIAWRFLPDGTVWIGAETWPDSGLHEITDFQVISEYPEAGSAALGVETPRLLPGVTLVGRRLSRVEHDVGETTRTRVWYEDDGATTDRTLAAWTGALGGSVVDTFYRGSYIGELIQQENDTVDVRFNDPRLPSMASVPIFGGVPGMRTTGATGGRVCISWGGADPAQPRAESFDADVTGQTTVINANSALFLGGEDGAYPPLRLTPQVVTWLAAVGAGSTAGPPPTDIGATITKVK